jgi:tripartite-type tricarboxylate transporter receptor subunit TctC
MVEAGAIDRAEGRVKELVAMPTCRITAALATLLALLATPVAAQSYPNRPITLVVPLPPGGTNDIMARAVADKLSASLGQQIVIDNRAAGGSGSVGTRQVAHGTAPDGYTILLGYTSTLATGPSLFRNTGYDPRKDFAPIGLIASAPALLLVHPSFPARNVKELIAIMKGSTEPFQLGTPGTGTVNYLAAVLFAQQAGVKVQYIPYKGSNALNTDLIGGHVKVGFNPIPVSRAALESGLIRALAGTSLKRSTAFPDLPTVAESGLPGFDAVLTYGLVAPAGTPRAIIERLNQELNAALATDEVKRRLHQEGAEPMPTTPEEHAVVIDREETKWSTLVKSAGLKAE